MRDKLKLARIIGESELKGQSRNIALNFALQHSAGRVVESILLRIAEALIHVLNPVAKQLLSREAVSKAGRTWISNVQEFQIAVTLRDEQIAHLVANRVRSGQRGVPESVKAYGGTYAFLERLLDRIEEILRELDSAGLYEGHDDLGGSYTDVDMFTAEDLKELVDAANKLVDDKGRSGS